MVLVLGVVFVILLVSARGYPHCPRMGRINEGALPLLLLALRRAKRTSNATPSGTRLRSRRNTTTTNRDRIDWEFIISGGILAGYRIRRTPYERSDVGSREGFENSVRIEF